jgi:hypothetical protein
MYLVSHLQLVRDTVGFLETASQGPKRKQLQTQNVNFVQCFE